MHKYDYSFLNKPAVSNKLINFLTSIYEIKAKDEDRKNNYPSIYSSLEKIAIIQSVKNSNAIENIITSDERINALVNQHSEPLNHDEEEIAGYRDVLNEIHHNHDILSFTETTLLSLHEKLLGKSKPNNAGKYKREDNIIMEIDRFGNRSIRFKSVSAKDTPNAIVQLFLSYLDARDNLNINPLLLIPCVILDFLCIHPFTDGNGRMSRLLTLLLLYKEGFDCGKYISLEEQINNNKNNYYEALKKSSIGWEENKNNYSYFIENFLITLFSCYKELDKRFVTVKTGKINKQSRIEATVLNSILPISKADICRILPDISPTTIELILTRMVNAHKIIKIGAGKSTRYKKI